MTYYEHICRAQYFGYRPLTSSQFYALRHTVLAELEREAQDTIQLPLSHSRQQVTQ